MTLEISALADGWADFRISIGDSQIAVRGSCLNDSIGSLAGAAVCLVLGGQEARCAIVEEPSAVVLVLQRYPEGGERVQISAFAIASWSDRAVMFAERSKRVLQGQCSVANLKDAILAALRRLRATYGTEDFRKRWHWPFPDQELDRLSAP